MIRSIPAALLAALALAACGGNEDSGDGNRRESGSPAAKTAVVELEDQLGFSSAGIMEQQIRVESLIQQCMQQNGF